VGRTPRRGRPLRAAVPLALFNVLVLLGGRLASQTSGAAPLPTLVPAVTCSDSRSRDQDDLCIWVHPTEPARSTVITSDKAAGQIFVYDLEGRTLQSMPARHPGNIDLRPGFPLGTQRVDIVAFNQRDDPHIVVCQVDPATRQLTRADDGSIRTGENYGGTLYRSAKSGRCYFVTTSKSGITEQYELTDNGAGRITGRKVRAWRVGYAEAAVADDVRGRLYIGEENKGVWEFSAEPDDAARGELVIRRGENGLASDVEGLALARSPGGEEVLIVSNQGKSNFKVYQRVAPYRCLGTFAVRGAKDTDGIDVCQADLGPRFPRGLFGCHTGSGRCPVLLTPGDAVMAAVWPGAKEN
jgi:3-phytase